MYTIQINTIRPLIVTHIRGFGYTYPHLIRIRIALRSLQIDTDSDTFVYEFIPIYIYRRCGFGYVTDTLHPNPLLSIIITHIKIS